MAQKMIIPLKQGYMLSIKSPGANKTSLQVLGQGNPRDP